MPIIVNSTQNSWNAGYNDEDGQLLIGQTGGNPTPSTLTEGFGITIDNAPGAITITQNGQVPWELITGTTHQMEIGISYATQNSGLVTLTLPEEVPFGTEFTVTNIGTGDWRIAQNSGQQIRFGNTLTTAGETGNLESLRSGDTVRFVCVEEDTLFHVISSIGNIKVDVS